MLAKIVFLSVLTTLFSDLVFIITRVNAEDWHYPEDDSEEFPEWGGLCDSGDMQSPIDLIIDEAQIVSYPTYTFEGYDEALMQPQIENNGHTVKVTTVSELKISGGPLESEYVLKEFHFHWESEHEINGMRYPIEMHLVHLKKDYGSLDEALNDQNGIAVVAILFTPSDENNNVIEEILKSLESVASSEKIGSPLEIEQTIVLRDLLPFDLSTNYFFYRGSLTTPPCSQAVSWTVYLEPRDVSVEQIERFKTIQTREKKYLRRNFRNIQSTNKRPVYFTARPARSAALSVKEFNFFAKVFAFLPLKKIIIN